MKDQKLTRQAYIDEQLSVDQTIAFEDGLSAAEKRDIERSRQFEAELAERLQEEIKCPPDLWDRLKVQLHAEADSRPGHRRRSWLKLASMVAAILVAAAAVYLQLAPQAAATDVLPPLFASFNQDLPVPGDYQKVLSALSAHKIHLNIKHPGPDGHPIMLHGMRIVQRDGEQIAELHFSCCDKPLIVYIAAADSKWCYKHLSGCSLPPRLFVAATTVDSYRITAVGPHDTQSILDLFS